MYEDEIWKDVVGYEGYYQVSNLGRVKSLDRVIYNKKYNKNNYTSRKKSKIMKPTLQKKGYYSVMLSKDGIAKRFEVHRLIGLTFLGKGSECFNHINGIPTDNRLENLEAVTFSENINHAIDVLHKHSRALVVEIYEDNEVKVFGSMAKAEKYLGKNRYWLKSKRKSEKSDVIKFENKIIKIRGDKS